MSKHEPSLDTINLILAGSYTELGIKAWWKKERFQLGGLSPEIAWHQGMKKEVYDLAYSLISIPMDSPDETAEEKITRIAKEFVEVLQKANQASKHVEGEKPDFQPRKFTEPEEVAFRNLKTMLAISDKTKYWISVPTNDIKIIVGYFIGNKIAENVYNKEFKKE